PLHNDNPDEVFAYGGEVLAAKMSVMTIMICLSYLKNMECIKAYILCVQEPPCTNMFEPSRSLRCAMEMTLLAQLKVMALSNVMVYFLQSFMRKAKSSSNSKQRIVMIEPKNKRCKFLDMTSSAQNHCKPGAKQNLVIGLPSLVDSKDKPCSSCEKGKHHRASFKIKQTSSIKKCLHLLHMDLFGPVTPRSINHEKYTLVIVDEYSRHCVKLVMQKGVRCAESRVSSPAHP
ncbi:hypothetical protein Tco_0671576, partial [Tanacetum coccineum]